MKKQILVALLLVFGYAGISQQPKRVVLITIDGFRPDFYLDSGWQTPRIRALVKGGFHANGVNSVLPSMTYPSHTTIVTGVQPRTHGVYYNGMWDPTQSEGKIYWNDSAIHSPTLAHVLHDKGYKVASLYWPVSAEAPVDYNIPDVGSQGGELQEQYTVPKGFSAEVLKNVFDNAPSYKIGKDQNIARIAAYIIQHDTPALMTIHLFSVDHAEHMQGRSGDSVKAAIADADEAVGIIEDALKQKGVRDQTVLIVTGDHGFVTVTRSVNPNVWLHEAGLLNDLKTGDWKAQFYPSGGTAYLYLKDPADKATADRVRNILKALPDTAKRFFRIMDKKKIEEIGGNPNVELVLSGLNGASFGKSDTGMAIKPGKGGTHGYFPDFREIRTGFIANGPGISQGSSIDLMNLRDIAPIVARILGISFPTAQGKIPEHIFVSNKKK